MSSVWIIWKKAVSQPSPPIILIRYIWVGPRNLHVIKHPKLMTMQVGEGWNSPVKCDGEKVRRNHFPAFTTRPRPWGNSGAPFFHCSHPVPQSSLMSVFLSYRTASLSANPPRSTLRTQPEAPASLHLHPHRPGLHQHPVHQDSLLSILPVPALAPHDPGTLQGRKSGHAALLREAFSSSLLPQRKEENRPCLASCSSPLAHSISNTVPSSFPACPTRPQANTSSPLHVWAQISPH